VAAAEGQPRAAGRVAPGDPSDRERRRPEDHEARRESALHGRQARPGHEPGAAEPRRAGEPAWARVDAARAVRRRAVGALPLGLLRAASGVPHSRETRRLTRRAAVLASAVLVLAGCGTSPKTSFYMLTVAPGTGPAASSLPRPVQVAAVHIPPSLD